MYAPVRVSRAEDQMNAYGITQLLRRACRDERGQDLLEYGLLVALIAVVAIGAVQDVGNTINTLLWEVIAIATGAI